MVARFSAPVQTAPVAHPASCTKGTGSFPGVQRPGHGAYPHPHLQCRGLKKCGAIPLPTLRALVAYKGGNFNFQQEDDMSGTGSWYGKEEKYIKGFVEKT